MRGRWLGTLLVAPLMLGGCSSGGGDNSAAGTANGAAGGKQPWVVVSAGNPTSTATPGSGYTAKPSVFPTGYLPTTSPAPTPAPTGLGCSPAAFHGRSGETPINGADVVPGATSASVTWWNGGGDDLVEYRVTAISQNVKGGDQRDVGWTVVTPGTECGFLTATVTGLDRRTDYVFSVDAVTTRLASDGTRAATVARSVVTRTT